MDAAERSRCLQLPKLDARIGELAGQFARGAAGDLEKAQAVERGLRTGYGYTLDLPRRKPADPLADFLFTRKKGHCEYFASSMAVLLRSQGIPARLATGFQSGIYNPLTNLWLIRSSDAHAWVEAWIPGRGWTTFDPTPPGPAGSPLATRLALYLDAADGLWREWVVSYDPSHQGSLMDRIQQSAARLGIRWFDTLSDAHSFWDGPSREAAAPHGPAPSGRPGAGSSAVAGGAAGDSSAGDAAGGAPRAPGPGRRRRRGAGVPADVADSEAARLPEASLVHAHGIRRVAAAHPVWETPPREFTAAYNAWRFGGRTEQAPRLSSLLEELRRAR